MAARGACGWPLTVLADEWGRPFYAATYMRPEELVELARVEEESWRGGFRGIAERAAKALESIMAPAYSGIPDKPLLGLADYASAAFDRAHGGFGGPPEFPRAPLLLALHAAYERHGLRHARDIVLATLHHIIAGGIHDWIDGGFHRYAVDRDWRTPHFEKMLYGQAVLARVIGEALKHGRDPVLEAAGEGVVRLLKTRFTTEAGLASSLDAEAGGGEGIYYSFALNEVKSVLGELYDNASEIFDFRSEGNYIDETTGRPSGRLLLHIGEPIPSLAGGLGVSVEEVLDTIKRVAAKLGALREGRGPPSRDWKVSASWNGLAVWGLSSLAAAGIPGALDLALEVYERVKERLIDGCNVYRVWSGSDACIEGFLPDYAHLSLGLLALHSVMGKDGPLELVHCLARGIPGRFQGSGGEPSYRPGGPMEVYEGPYPSGYSSAVEVMWRLGGLLGDGVLRVGP